MAPLLKPCLMFGTTLGIDADIGCLKMEAVYQTDGYASALNKQPSQPDLSASPPPTSTSGPAGTKLRKPRKRQRGVEIIEGLAQKHEQRWLPPGKMMQYWLQYKLQANVSPPAGFSTFWRATWLTISCQ